MSVRELLLLALSACTSAPARPTTPPPAAQRRDEAEPALVRRVEESPPPADAPFRIDRRVESYETFVDVRPTDASCPSIDWRPRSKMIRFERCRDRPLEDQVDTLRGLVEHLRSTEGPEVDAAGLLIGMDWVNYPAAVRRMIEHARTHGPRARVGTAKYVVAIAAERELFPELATIFAPRKPVLVSAEGCSAASSTDRDYSGEWLRSENITGRNLPVGCLSGLFDLRE